MAPFDVAALAALLPPPSAPDAQPPPLDATPIRDAMAWLALPADACAAVDQGLIALTGDEQALPLWQRFHHHWILGGPQRIEEARRWPALSDPPGALFYALLCLAGVPHGRALLQGRDLPPEVVRASLADVVRQMEQCRNRHGCWGVEQPRWLGRHLHGRLVEIGRLQYEVGVLSDKLANRADPVLLNALGQRGASLDTPVWWIHIPGGSPLSSQAVDASLQLAGELLPRHFPEHRALWLGCCSWILDRQLREYLPADANLLRFADRFALVYEHDGDPGFTPFPFSGQPVERMTRLQQAAQEHHNRGRSWRAGLGLIRAAGV
jgi:hypothetical protein